MEQKHIEVVRKIFVVVGGKRKCLICEGMFSQTQAANHAPTLCYPSSQESGTDAGSVDPCSPLLPSIDFSSSQRQA